MDKQTQVEGGKPVPERPVGRSLGEDRSGGNGLPARRYEGQVEPGPRRRRYSEAYKAKILREVENAQQYGQIGLILRREGLYSSQITQWRQAMGKNDAENRKLRNENARLKRETIRLKVQLEQSRKLIEIQKKMAEFVQELERKESCENPSP